MVSPILQSDISDYRGLSKDLWMESMNEWGDYGEILKGVDKAKQWAIGDWLCDGKRHYGDGTYKEAIKILGLGLLVFGNAKRLSEFFEIKDRSLNLSWRHHHETASIKQIEEDAKGKLRLSKKPDMEGMCLWFISYVSALFIVVFFFILVFRRDNICEIIITYSLFFCRQDKVIDGLLICVLLVLCL